MTFLISELATTLDYAFCLDQMTPAHLDVAFFGMGCFLNSEPRFGTTKGVWRTLVGYSGGKYNSPTHDATGDHIETVKIEYDPHSLSYGQLLELFMLWHCPSQESALPQHASCVFVKNEFERRLALAAISRYELCSGDIRQTQVMPYRTFCEAEKTCQKYYLRSFPQIIEEIQNYYSDENELIHSALAARLNGILGYSASSRALLEDFQFYDLSESIVRALKCALGGVQGAQ